VGFGGSDLKYCKHWDKRDFEEAARGFAAVSLFEQIVAEAGNLICDMRSYELLLRSV